MRLQTWVTREIDQCHTSYIVMWKIPKAGDFLRPKETSWLEPNSVDLSNWMLYSLFYAEWVLSRYYTENTWLLTPMSGPRQNKAEISPGDTVSFPMVMVWTGKPEYYQWSHLRHHLVSTWHYASAQHQTCVWTARWSLGRYQYHQRLSGPGLVRIFKDWNLFAEFEMINQLKSDVTGKM